MSRMVAVDAVLDRVSEGLAVHGDTIAEAGGTFYGVARLEAFLAARGYVKRVSKLMVIWTKKREGER